MHKPSPAFWNVAFFSFESVTRVAAQAHENVLLSESSEFVKKSRPGHIYYSF